MRRFHVWILLLFFFTLLSCGDDDPVPVVAGSLESSPIKHVYGYAYKSDLTKSSMTKDLEREQITAVALHAAYPESNGDIGDFDVTTSTVADFVDKAHAHGVKVHLNIACFSSSDSKSVLKYHKNKMTSQIMDLVDAGNLDGVCLDFENIPKEEYYRDLFATFSEILSEKLHEKNMELFIAVGNRPGGDDDPDRLAAAADGLFIMGYAYAGPWSSYAGPTAPLTTGGKWWAAYSTYLFDEESEKTWVAKGVDPKKLILGVPFYGYRWQTYGLGVKSQTVSGTAKALTISYIISKYGKEWDSYSQTPYYAWSSGGDYYQVWYDDAESFALKFSAANAAGYGGIGMWKLPWATDDVWDEIKKYQEAE
jgi:spore germination protein YaaH